MSSQIAGRAERLQGKGGASSFGVSGGAGFSSWLWPVRAGRASESLSENPGARLCRPRPAAAGLVLSAREEAGRVLRLVCNTAALHFQTGSERMARS